MIYYTNGYIEVSFVEDILRPFRWFFDVVLIGSTPPPPVIKADMSIVLTSLFTFLLSGCMYIAFTSYNLHIQTDGRRGGEGGGAELGKNNSKEALAIFQNIKYYLCSYIYSVYILYNTMSLFLMIYFSAYSDKLFTSMNGMAFI